MNRKQIIPASKTHVFTGRLFCAATRLSMALYECLHAASRLTALAPDGAGHQARRAIRACRFAVTVSSRWGTEYRSGNLPRVSIRCTRCLPAWHSNRPRQQLICQGHGWNNLAGKAIMHVIDKARGDNVSRNDRSVAQALDVFLQAELMICDS